MRKDADDRQASSEEGPPSAPGDILAGKYCVERLLGVGGMGKVVAAVHMDLMERRAIKFMHAKHLGDAEAVERFLREARASARLSSEHVVKVHDVGRLENGAPYMVMEYLEGADLGAEIDRRGSLPLAEAVEYVLEACEALTEAHAAGIVHRDLKPENLFLAKTRGGPSIKVLDFGISKLITDDPNQMRMTRTTAVMGSPYYMSPEQTQASHDVDARADIWSLGVVLYQLVTGHLPFTGKNLTMIISNVMFAPCRRPSSLVPGLPQELDQIVLRCLEKHRSRRYASIAELAADLQRLAPAARELPALRTTRRTAPLEDSISTGAVATDPTVPIRAPRPPWRLIAASAALVIGAGASVFIGLRFVDHGGVAPAQSTDPSSFHAPSLPELSAPPPAATVSTAVVTVSASASALPLAAPHPSTHTQAVKAPARGSASTKPPEPPALAPADDPFGAGRQ
jgi:serine/threonine-protein kinase